MEGSDDLWDGVRAILDLVQEWLDWPGGLTLSEWLDRREGHPDA